MRTLLQRVTHASPTVNHQITGQINQGLLILLGVGQTDTEVQVQPLADKIVHLFLYSPSYHLLLGSKREDDLRVLRSGC